MLRYLGFAALLLAGCAIRPVNPPIAEFHPGAGYTLASRKQFATNPDLVILAFSGGGTRAAAFSYGVLEALRRTEIVGPTGKKEPFLDKVNLITGVSGGSFTALAYGLYGDKLFDIYERAFLERNVQGELIAQVLDPLNWGALSSTGWGRSEMAAELYDRILFHGATFRDLDRGNGPLISVTATDLATGFRVPFNQGVFNIFCSDLDAVPLSRAAAASSAVPVALSAVTLNNYGGTCDYHIPQWLQRFENPATMPRPAARVAAWLKEMEIYNDSAAHPYVHLVDGGVSDNVGLRSVMDVLQAYLASRLTGEPTPLDHLRNIVVFVVNSQSDPSIDWDKRENPPGIVATLLKVTGEPIDRNSDEAIEQLKDMAANWQLLRRIRSSPAFTARKDPTLSAVMNAPNIDLHVIDVSFGALRDKAEVHYLDNLPTSFVLPDKAVDRLRAAAGEILRESPDFQQLLHGTRETPGLALLGHDRQ
ncbi:MAG: patatin-like phospholipase family protein [Acetobacteraceae bacterium]